MRFNIGEKAVYPAHGVAEIVGIESRDVAGKSIDCYILQFLDSGAKLMVPVAFSERAGMRRPIERAEIEKVYGIMKRPIKMAPKAWNRRQKEFSEKIRSGMVCEVAEVFRDLYSMKMRKELSFGEKQMLEKSKILILSELSAAQNITFVETECQLAKELSLA